MGLSAKFAIFICTVTLTSASSAQAATVVRSGLHAMRTTITPRGPGSSATRVLRPGLRGRRGYGFAGDGLGIGVAGLDAPLPGPDADPYPPPLPPRFAIPAPPPPCPQIIEIGRGLTHKVETRVISGAPLCGP